MSDNIPVAQQQVSVPEEDQTTSAIQVVNDDNREEDFRRSYFPVGTGFNIIGRPPFLNHAQNSTRDLREASSDRSREVVIPDDFYRYPLDEEVEQFIPTARERLQETCNGFQEAYGLVLAFSNDIGCENTESIPNIHNSSEMVCTAFNKLGYAYRTFKNCSKMELLAVYHQLSKMEFPSSYKAIFIYFTGHGKNNHISTTDGYISINYLKNLLSETKAPNLRNVVKVLFFDCCRTGVNVEDIPRSRSEENLMVFYMVPLGQQSFIVNEAGMSVGTMTLVQLLGRMEPCSLVRLFSVDISREIRKKIRNEPMRIDFEGSLTKNIDLYQDMRRARSPTKVQLTEDWDQDVCTLTWLKPLHANYLIEFCIASTSIDGPIAWEILQDGISADSSSYELHRGLVSGKKLTVVATYSEVDVQAVDYGESPAVHLKSESITPKRARLTILSSGEGTLTWSTPGLGRRQLVSIQRRDINSNHTSDGGWEDLKVKIPVTGHTYLITDEDVEASEYRMKIHAKGMNSPWVPAEEHSVNCGYRQKLKDLQLNKCCFIIFIIILLFMVFLIGSFACVQPLFQHHKPSHTSLAVGGDLIDCERLKSWQKMFIQAVFITQEVTDTRNDNKNGLDMKIMSIKTDKLVYHHFNYNGTANFSISNDTTEPFVIPNDYFNRPLYMWEGSNITANITLSDYEVLPEDATLYVICGDENFNFFTNNPHSKPRSEHSFSLLNGIGQTFLYTTKNHGYYYVVVQVNSRNEIQFFADVQFDILYLDSADYDFSKASTSNEIGKTVQNSFGIKGSITLCYVMQSVDDFQSNTIHILLQYDLRELTYIIPGILNTIVAVVCVILIVYVILIVCNCCNCRNRKPYSQLSSSLHYFAH